MGRRFLTLTSLSLVSTGVMPARALEPPSAESVQFAWVRGEGAEGCAAEAAIEQQIALRLGRAPFSGNASRSVEGIVAREGERWIVRIVVREGKSSLGSRQIASDAPDCKAIEAASILAIALIIDPEATLRELPRAGTSDGAEPAPAPAKAPPRPASAPRPAPPNRAEPPATKLRLTSAVHGGVSLGLLPRPAPTIAWSASLKRNKLEAWAGVTWAPEVRTSDDKYGFGLTTGWLGLCFSIVRFSRGSLLTCGAVAGGAIHAVVYRLEPVEPGQQPWVAGLLSERLRVAVLPPLVAEVGVNLLAPWTRYQFVTDNRPVFTQPPAAMTVLVGLGVSIP
jgi:hypothetical protein